MVKSAEHQRRRRLTNRCTGRLNELSFNVRFWPLAGPYFHEFRGFETSAFGKSGHLGSHRKMPLVEWPDYAWKRSLAHIALLQVTRRF